MKRFFILFISLLFFAQTYSQDKFTVVVPIDYQKDLSYPLFIVFHGGNGNMKSMMQWWKSETLSKNFIVAYMEASTLDNYPNRWGWRNLTEERKNVKHYYAEIINEYNVDVNQVYVGGFSLGGKMSVDLALNPIIPVKGFISLNHGGGTTHFFTDNNVIAAKQRGVRAVLISGEKDFRYKKESEKIKTLLSKHDFSYKFIESKNTGHSIPKAFSVLLDSCLEFIMDN